ncbi:MAG: NUDIX domain-containing protein [Pseudomonadota bacterium]
MHRVGIIPFDIKDDLVAVLFVTSQTRGRWILPKGQIEPGENQTAACHREGFEEAGVKGIVLEDFPSTVVVGKQTKAGLQKVPVTYYPLLVQEQFADWPDQAKRQRHWALIEDAPKVSYRADYLNVVQQFQALKPWIIAAARPHKALLQEEQSPAQ